MLVGALVWLDQGTPSTDDRARARDRLFPGLDRSRATRVEIVRPEGRTVLSYDGQAWWVEGEPRLRAEEPAVDQILGTLEFGHLERRVASAGVRHGLDAPRATLTVAGTTFSLGADDPSGRGVYLRRSGDPDVLVAEHRLLEVVDQPTEAFRSRRLTLASPDAATRVAVGDVTIARTPAGFRLERPVAARAEPKAVQALVDALATARADRRLDGAPEPGGVPIALDGRVEARLLGACPGNPGERLVVREDGARLCFAKDALAPLEAPASALREPRPFPFELNDVVAVDVTHGDTTLRLRREDFAWRLVAPLDAAGPASDPAVRAFVAPLLALTGPPPEAGATVRVVTRDDEASATVDPRVLGPLQPARFK